jgi:hypothetical protein
MYENANRADTRAKPDTEGRPTPPAAVQLKRELAALGPDEQLRALKPPKPLKTAPDTFAPADRVVQQKDDDGESLREKVPEQIDLAALGVSFNLPANTALTNDWNQLQTTSSTYVSIHVTPELLSVSFSPGLLVDIQWPISNVAWGGVQYDFKSAQVSSVHLWNTQRAAANGTGFVRPKVEEFVTKLVQGTPMAEAGYDPFADPDILGTLKALQKNLASQGEGESSIAASDLTKPSFSATVVFQSEIRQVAGEGGVLIPAGQALTARVLFDGSVEELTQGDNRSISQVTIDDAAIEIQHEGESVARLKRLYIFNGGLVSIREWEPMGKAAKFAGAESLVRLFGHLLTREGHLRLRSGTADINPTIVAGLTVKKIEEALAGAIRQAIVENRHAIPNVDLAEMLGLGG